MSYDLETQAKIITAEIEYQTKKGLNIGLDKAADELIEALEKGSPSDPQTKTKKYKDSWKVNRKYHNVRYVGNTKMVKSADSDNVPLSNLLEFSENGKPHIRKIYDELEDKLADVVINEISKIFD